MPRPEPPTAPQCPPTAAAAGTGVTLPEAPLGGTVSVLAPTSASRLPHSLAPRTPPLAPSKHWAPGLQPKSSSVELMLQEKITDPWNPNLPL